MNMSSAARRALVAPLLVAGGVLVLAMGNANVLAASPKAASANLPQSSSRPHKHERVECDPGRVAEKHGDCAVTFVDPKTEGEPSPVGQQVCFSVSPSNAGSVGTGAGHCTHVGNNHKAFGTFTASGDYCGKAVITAEESGPHEQAHHTTITIVCTKKEDATTTAAFLPAGGPSTPTTGGWLLGAMGVCAATVTAYALRTRRRAAPGRRAAGQSA